MAVAELMVAESTAVDVGSGAGLPGIPLALSRTDLRITLLEPLLRRANFLMEVVEELDLTERLTVVRSRAEDHRITYDAVLSRALAPLDRLVAWCAPLRSPDGVLLAIKGRSAADEVTRAAPVLRRERLRAEVLRVQAHPSLEATAVVRLRSGQPARPTVSR